MKYLIVISTLLLVIITPAFSFAAVHYVRSGSNGNGSSWLSAFSDLPASLNRGDVYYIAGGNYRAHNFNDSGSGLITIKKATRTDHGTDQGWKDEYATSQAVFRELNFSKNNYLLDGQEGGGPGQWTTGLGFRIEAPDYETNAVGLEPGVRGLTFRHIEIKQLGNSRIDAHPNAAFHDGDTYSYDLVFSHLYIHNFNGLAFYLGHGSNVLIEKSYMSGLCGAARANKDQHCEHLVSRGLDNLVVRYNIFKDVYSSGALVVNAGGDNSSSKNWEIYGNVFIHNQAVPIANNGPKAENWRIFNNTVIGGDSEFSLQNESGTMAYNNLVDSTTHLYPFPGKHDYNTFTNPPKDCTDEKQTQKTMNYAEHENGTNETCSEGTDAVIYVPAAQFVDVEANNFNLTKKLPTFKGQNGYGVNVCTLPGIHCDRNRTYDLDPNGKKRGLDGNWDRGAYELGANPVLTGDCIDLKTDLSFGKGEKQNDHADIGKLQKFLISKQYTNGGQLRATGYFGRNTLSSVQTFQKTFLPVVNSTGYVDSVTRGQIRRLTCQQ